MRNFDRREPSPPINRSTSDDAPPARRDRVAGRHATRRPLPGSAVVVLIDYSNFFPPGDIDPTDSALRHALLRLAERVISRLPNVEWILLRLYGGWMQDGALTSVGSKVSQLVQLATPFPVAVGGDRLVHGEIQLALDVAGVEGLNMEDTFRRRQGPSRLQLSQSPVPEGCAVHASRDCPMRAVALLTRRAEKTCPVRECQVTPRSAFVVHEQKMVDVMMASDILYYCRDSTATGVVVVTCDTDLLPSLCYAASITRVPLVLAPLSACWTAAHTHLLDNMGVPVDEVRTDDGAG